MQANTLQGPIVLTKAPPGTPAWLEAHKWRIGSNDLAVLLGIPRFGRTKMRLWAELTGKLERDDLSNLPEIRRGVLLEPVVRRLFEDATANEVLPSPGLIQHPTLPYVACTPDGLVGTKPIELKTVGQYARKDWDLGIPPGTEVQGNGHAWVLGEDAVYWAAFCMDAKKASAGDDQADDEDEEENENEDVEIPKTEDPLLLRAHRPARKDLQEALGEEAVDLWENHVLKDIPPDPGHDFKVVKAIWKKSDHAKYVTLTGELEVAWIRDQELKNRASALTRELKALKKERDTLKAPILVAMKDAEYGITPGKIIIRARETKGGGYFVDPYTYRPMIQVKALGA